MGSINLYPQKPLKIQPDKVLHFVGSYALTNASYEYFQPIYGKKRAFIYSSAFALSVGIGKEVYDYHTDGLFSSKDILANISGIMLFNITITF